MSEWLAIDNRSIRETEVFVLPWAMSELYIWDRATPAWKQAFISLDSATKTHFFQGWNMSRDKEGEMDNFYGEVTGK